MLWVLRNSYGWSRKTTNPVSARQIAKEINLTKSSVHRAVSTLLAEKIISLDEKGGFKINKDYDAWMAPAFGEKSAPVLRQKCPSSATKLPTGAPVLRQKCPSSATKVPQFCDSYKEKERKERKTLSLERAFFFFWENYPKKTAKPCALKTWLKLDPNEALVADIMSALTQYKLSDEWQRENGRYIPHPAKWLDQKRWEDEIEQNENYNPDLLATH